MIVTLEWEGPFSIVPRPMGIIPSAPELLARHGLYLLTVESAGGYLINYVGQTGRSFSQRPIKASIQWSYGKRFKDKMERSREMVDPDEFARGHRVVTETPTREQFDADYPRFERLLDQLYASFRIFLAPTDVDSPTRRLIEAGIIRELRQSGDPKVRDFLYNLSPSQPSRTPFKVTMRSETRFHGLGATFRC